MGRDAISSYVLPVFMLPVFMLRGAWIGMATAQKLMVMSSDVLALSVPYSFTRPVLAS